MKKTLRVMNHNYPNWFNIFMEVCALAVTSRSEWEWSTQCTVLHKSASPAPDCSFMGPVYPLEPDRSRAEEEAGLMKEWSSDCHSLCVGTLVLIDSDLVCRAHFGISATLPHIRWNQSSPLRLESKIIHGTFSLREKNVNHIVSGVLEGQVFVVPHPPTPATESNSSQFLELAQAKQIME